jgi:hypothetical protein
MVGGASNRNFAHHKYCIASPPRRKHFLSILFVATANQGARFRLPSPIKGDFLTASDGRGSVTVALVSHGLLL